MATNTTDLFHDIYIFIEFSPILFNGRKVFNRHRQLLRSRKIETSYRNGAFVKRDYYCNSRHSHPHEYNVVYFKINGILFLDHNIPSDGQLFFIQNQVKTGRHVFIKEIENPSTRVRHWYMSCIFIVKDSDSDSYNISPGINVTDVIPRHEDKSDEIVIGFCITFNKSVGQRTQSRFGPDNGYGGVFQLMKNDSLSIPTLRDYMTRNDYFGIYIKPNARLILIQECATLSHSNAKTDPNALDYYKYSDDGKTKPHHQRTLFLGGTYIFAEGLLGFMFPQHSDTINRLEAVETEIRAVCNDISIDCQNSLQLWLFLNEINSDFNTVCWGLVYSNDEIDEINWCLVIPEDARIEKISSISEGITDTYNRLRHNDTTKQYELTKVDQPLTPTSAGQTQRTPQSIGAQHNRPQHFASQQTNPRNRSQSHGQQSFRSNTLHSQQPIYQSIVSTPQSHILPQTAFNQPLFATYNPNQYPQSVSTNQYNPFLQPQTGQMLYNQSLIPTFNPFNPYNSYQYQPPVHIFPNNPHHQQQQPIIQYQQPQHPQHQQQSQLSTHRQPSQPYYGNNTPPPFGFHPNQQQWP